jgi:hypothetical protein
LKLGASVATEEVVVVVVMTVADWRRWRQVQEQEQEA